MFPSLSDYNNVIKTSGDTAFSTLRSLLFTPSRTVPFKIYTFGAGAFAVVFKAICGGKTYAIRCFTSNVVEYSLRSRLICEYFQTTISSWKVNYQYLDNEILVNDAKYPIIFMEWADGVLINQFVSNNLHNLNVLTLLQEKLIGVSRDLELNKIGHGDLQCRNIIINDDNGITIKLIDYDGVYVPALSGRKNIENGRSEFQHPKRTEDFYNEKVDRFSIWVMITALEALKHDKSLWLEVMQGGFNTLDNFLFTGNDFRNFNNSNLVNRLYGLNKASVSYYLNSISSFCHSNIEGITIPELYQTSGLDSIGDSTDNIEISRNLILVSSRPLGAVVLTSTFIRLGITPLQIAKLDFIDKNIIISYKDQTVVKKVEEHLSEINCEFTVASNSGYNSESTYLKEDIVNPPLNTASSNPELNNANSQDSKEDYSYAWLIIVLIITIWFVLFYVKNKDNYSKQTLNSSYDTIGIDRASTDTVILSNIDVEPIDSVAIVDFKNRVDEAGLTSTVLVESFFSDLNNKNYNEAWKKTANPSWNQWGEEWFVSENGYGSVTKVILEKIFEISATEEGSSVYIKYYAEGSNDSKMCYTQKISVKLYIDNGVTKWFITKVKNISNPYECYIPE